MGINLFIGFCIGLIIGTIFGGMVEHNRRERKDALVAKSVGGKQ